MNIDSKNPCIEFSKHAICDRCIARAYMCAEKEGLILTFCKHHGEHLENALGQDGWTITWDTVGLEIITPVSYTSRIPVPA